MSNFTSCSNNELTVEQLIQALITKNSAGELAIRTVFVDGSSLDGVSCDNNQLTVEQLFKSIVGLQGTKAAIRLALPKGDFLNGIETYANDSAAATGGIPVGGIYYKTGVGLHTRMS